MRFGYFAQVSQAGADVGERRIEEPAAADDAADMRVELQQFRHPLVGRIPSVGIEILQREHMCVQLEVRPEAACIEYARPEALDQLRGALPQ